MRKGTTRSSRPTRAVWSRSRLPTCSTPSGIQSTAVYSCNERKDRLLPSQSRTAVRSAAPVSREMARAPKEVRPQTRARIQKKRSVVKGAATRPRPSHPGRPGRAGAGPPLDPPRRGGRRAPPRDAAAGPPPRRPPVAEAVHRRDPGPVAQPAAQLPGPQRLPQQVLQLVADRNPGSRRSIEPRKLAVGLESGESRLQRAHPGLAPLQVLSGSAGYEERAGGAESFEVARARRHRWRSPTPRPPRAPGR